MKLKKLLKLFLGVSSLLNYLYNKQAYVDAAGK